MSVSAQFARNSWTKRGRPDVRTSATERDRLSGNDAQFIGHARLSGNAERGLHWDAPQELTATEGN